jgi:hypothetical protein
MQPLTLTTTLIQIYFKYDTRSIHRNGDDGPVGRHGVEKGGLLSSGLLRRLPISSGLVCYGDHCNFGRFDAASGLPLVLEEVKRVRRFTICFNLSASP